MTAIEQQSTALVTASMVVQFSEMMPQHLRLAAVAVLVSACGDDCVTPPCGPPIAAVLSITSASSTVSLPAGVFLTYTIEGSSGSGLCSPGATVVCELFGAGGTYQIAIGAPGFQTQTRTEIVTEADPPKCGCRSIGTLHFSVALVPGA